MTLRRLVATKTFACLSISLLLSACSSNSGDGKDIQPPPSGQTPPQMTEIELQGVASKGLLYGAQIRAYEISTQGLVGATPLATTSTDEAGHYQLTLPGSAHRRPILIRAQVPDDGSVTMRCDLANGCGDDIGFGESFAVTEEITLSTLVSSLSAEPGPAHITVLTSLYSQMALESLPTAANSEEMSAHFMESDRQLGQRFGLHGGIAHLEVIDITQAEHFDASEYVLSYNLLGSALIDAMRQHDSELSIGQALKAITDRYSREGIADRSDPDSAFSLAKTLAAKSQLLEHIVEHVEPNANLTPLITSTSARAAQTAMGSTVPNQGIRQENFEQDHLAKVKNMVTDVRDLAHGGFLSQTDQDLMDQFGEQIDTVENLASPQAQLLHRALKHAGNAFGAAWLEVQDQPSSVPMQFEYQIDEDTVLTVTMEAGDNSTSYRLDQQITLNGLDITLQLTAQDQQSSLHLGEEQSHADIRLEMQGKAHSEHFHLTLEGGQLRASAQLEAGELANNGHLTLAQLDLDLQVTLAETEAHSDNPLHFIGQLKLNLGALELHARQSDDEDQLTDRPKIVTNHSDIQALLSGEYANQSGERFASSFSLISQDIHYQWCSETPAKFSITSGFDRSLAIQGNLSVPASFDAPASDLTCVWHMALGDSPQLAATYVTEIGLAGISDRMSLEVTWSPIRSQNQSTIISFEPLNQLMVKLSYEDKHLSLEYNEFQNQLKATNQEQVVLQVERRNGDDFFGEIRYQDVPYATISQNRNGLVLVRFVDGTVESF